MYVYFLVLSKTIYIYYINWFKIVRNGFPGRDYLLKIKYMATISASLISCTEKDDLILSNKQLG